MQTSLQNFYCNVELIVIKRVHQLLKKEKRVYYLPIIIIHIVCMNNQIPNAHPITVGTIIIEYSSSVTPNFIY